MVKLKELNPLPFLKETIEENQSRSWETLTRGLFQVLTTAILLIMIGGPMLFYIWGSVWSETPGTGGSLTFGGYARLIDPVMIGITGNTLVVAVAGTFLALLFAVLMMVFTIKVEMPGRNIIATIVIIQYLFPSFIMGLAWRYYAGPDGPVNQAFMLLPFVNNPVVDITSLWGITIVGALHYAGLIYLLTSAAVKAIPASMEEIGRISGASSPAIVREISMKLALPSLAISAVIVFTRMAQMFGLPLVLGLPDSVFVLSTRMYLALSTFPQDFALGSALGMMILVVTLFGLVGQRKITGTRDKYQTMTGGGETTESYTFELEGTKGTLIGGAFFVVVFLVFVMPFLTLAVAGFQNYFFGFDFEQAEWTLDNYETLFVGDWSNRFWLALKNSLLIAGGGAAVGMMLSVAASYIIVKGDSWLSDFTDFLTLMPIAMPGIVYATAYLWFFLNFNVFGLYGTVWIIMIALVGKFIIYGTRAANSAFNSIGDELEEAGRLGGAGLFSIFRYIHAPLIKAGVFSGFVILFIDFVKVLTIPLLLGARGNVVLPTLIWAAVNSSRPQIAAAVTTIMVALIATLYIGINYLTDIDVTAI